MHVRVHSQQRHFAAEGEGGIHAIVRIARRNLEFLIARLQGHHAFCRGLFCQHQPHVGLIGRGLPFRHVMHFEHDVRPGRNQLRLTGHKHIGRLPWSITNQPIAGHIILGHLLPSLGRRSHEELLLRLVLEVVRSRLADIGNNVVHHRAIGRRSLHILHPRVLGKARRNNHVLVVQNARRRNRKRMRQLVDLVRLWNRPSLNEVDRRRQVLRVPLWGARIDPGSNGIDLRLRHRAIVLELLRMPILEPRRHGAGHHHTLHRRGPGPRLFVAQHRERCALSRPMTTLAVLLHDRRNILGKGHVRSFRNRNRSGVRG